MRSSGVLIRYLACAVLVLASSGCTFAESFVPKDGAKTDVLDRDKNLTINDFRDLDKVKEAEGSLHSKVNMGEVTQVPAVPDLAQVLAAPRPPKVGNTKLVTLSVTEDVPLRDVLFELGRLADVDIEVGSGLDAYGVNVRATNRPFNEVIERIADLGGLRYSVSGSAIRVERDLPYIKSYPIDFLNMERSGVSGYQLNTTGSGGAASSGGGGGTTSASTSGGGSSGGGSGGGSSGGLSSSGSTSAISATVEGDLWKSLRASINEILSYKPAGDKMAATVVAPAGATASTNLVINQQAGVISVSATEHQHEMIQRYLTMMMRNVSAQVLIEAKIVEVSLADQFVSGISWNKVLGTIGKNYVNIGSYGATAPEGLDVPTSPFVVGVESGDLDAVLVAAQQFGTVRALSNPRLSAVNNQMAVLTFTRNEVTQDCTYTPATFTTNALTGVKEETTKATYTCERGTLPIGIILSIMPAINLDTQEVTLNVRPTLNRVVGKELDREAEFARSQAENPSDLSLSYIPVVETREIESIARMKSGAVMVIGGLMRDATSNTQNGLPGASEMPIFGNLFKSRSEDTQKSELIIFIKATIVNPDGSAQRADKVIVDKFVTDPRPLF